MLDLIQVLKDEFNVNVWIEEHNADSLDIGALAEDANLSHQIEQSRNDRKFGRVYDHPAGIEYLRTPTLNAKQIPYGKLKGYGRDLDSIK